ncbi:uncharacterized protein Z520_08912 [Fonsecaea multimorphosa CBS 102226]|uniref:Uncharacterized protein n=1 Tax=Fonsecaea multimorphosa CBS 102226 TaxID=1442371 RepID=A0A0D2H0R8_9EURO|nr:uncharacterized protein Z520_08912 [Fonsecaea multimorphosa CBS 102226]KIX95395.1 hypothetical protein Z520_08912 [Fonsecaea multimorphosa CBS 102226]OAL21061.1 hypothetical protein AYO22_08345 [Fonsecaea multimorphosa]
MEGQQGYMTLAQRKPPRLELPEIESPLPDFSDNNEAKVTLSENGAKRAYVTEEENPKPPTPDRYSLLDKTGREPQEIASAWRAGNKARIPFLSLCCLLIMFLILVAMIIILVVSDGQDVESWGATTMKIGGHSHYWQIGVSAWLALANFLLSKTLAIMFAEAVAVSWWVDAIRGQTLQRLHFRWAVGNSIHKVAVHWRLWSWICVGSLAFTIFAGLEVVLQQASSSTTVLSLIPRNMTSELASALPAGFSGVVAAVGHDVFGVVYFTQPFIQVLQDYKIQSPVSLDLKGCDSTSNVSCTTRLPGVGFQYTCNATRSSLLDPLSDDSGSVQQPNNTVFQVNVTAGIDWEIGLSALWQDKRGYQGETITNRHCTLLPALVEYPINVTQGVATLQAATSPVEWTTSPTNPDDEALLVDKVLSLLPIPDHEKTLMHIWINEDDPNAGLHSTLGGIGLAFSSLFGSSIVVKSDVTNFGSDVAVTGSFAAPYAIFEYGTANIDNTLNNTYASPMDALLSNIRDIMFRSSVMIATQKVGDYKFPNSSYNLDIQTSNVPVQNVTGLGEYRIYHTVYKTNRTVLGVAVGLMLLAILAILPLYDGYWLLGRNVSLSPFEVAKALHYSTIVDDQTGTRNPYSVLDMDSGPDQVPQSGSNLSADELVKVLGSRKVRYGEVAPNVLGVGLIEYTDPPKAGRLYD